MTAGGRKKCLFGRKEPELDENPHGTVMPKRDEEVVVGTSHERPAGKDGGRGTRDREVGTSIKRCIMGRDEA
jgi:hypothetical protein